MPINTASKRASALGVGLAFILNIIPSGAVDQADRQTTSLSYGGILASAPVIDTPDCFTSMDGVISDAATALTGIIDNAATAASGTIEPDTMREGLIDAADTAVGGLLDGTGVSADGEIQDTFAIDSLIC